MVATVAIIVFVCLCPRAYLRKQMSKFLTRVTFRAAVGTEFLSPYPPHTHTIRYDTRCYFNVRSKADISQLNLPHGTDN